MTIARTPSDEGIKSKNSRFRARRVGVGSVAAINPESVGDLLYM